ncbi:MAG: MobP3 family relaxase [Oscillospiraceae bacterium]|nr:MobP3 family relaxase [Oscillospiraceae bacterium]
MPKIIFTSRYIKNPARANAGKLVRYMGMRDGVEKLPGGIDHKPATKKQKELVCVCITAYPEAMEYLEFETYREKRTKNSATEFIGAFIERNADRIDGIKKLVSYIGERPGVEKLGRHGLFSQTDDKIDIDAVADEVSNHEGILWTHVISLRREDAERLGYNSAGAWKGLMRRSALQVAEAHKIDPSDMQWYAAFHNTTHHPHLHMIVYSKKLKQGYLTNKAIEKMRGMFANDIFRNEQYHLFALQTKMRDELKDEVKERLDELYRRSQEKISCDDKMHGLFEKLIGQLKNHQGKMLYGYLVKPIKETVDTIVAELAKDSRVADFYAEWNNINREKLSTYYDKPKPDIPLEENKEFRSIKNSVVRTAVLMMKLSEQSQQPISAPEINSAVTGLVSILGRLFSTSCQKQYARLNTQIDSKLKSKIAEKKLAQGLKIDRSYKEDIDEDEEQEQGFGLSL